MKYSIEQMERIAARLQSIPKLDKTHPTLTKQEGITLLNDEITKLRKDGHSLERISEILHDIGFEITSSTLKNYLQRAKESTQEGVKTGTKPTARAKQGKHPEANPGFSTPPLPSTEIQKE